MSPSPAVLVHEALAAVEGEALPEADLNDQQRLAVLLQGLALLGHLERSGLSLTRGWRSARVAASRRLVGVEVTAGHDDVPPQRRAEELLLSLFNAHTAVAGRGVARRAARELLGSWRQDVARVRADRLVDQLLESAPFLWQRSFGEARTALVAQSSTTSELLVTGPAGPRRRLLALGGDLEATRSLLAGAEARQLWAGGGGGSGPQDLARAGHWRRAVGAWQEKQPSDAAERLDYARALYAVGRFDAAKTALHGLRRKHARVLRLACQLRSGELAAAKRALNGWREGASDAELCLDLAAIAVRLFASLGDPEAADSWLVRALASGDPKHRLRARLLVGESAWDRGDLDRVEAEIAATSKLAGDPDLAWRRFHLQALLAMAQGDGRAVVRSMTGALASRRRIRPFEAAGLWNDLAVGRSMEGDLGGAERALRHAARLTEDCEGDRRLTLALCNLAEVRLRRGRVRGVADVLRRTTRANLQAGNLRGWAHDRELAARLQLVRGRPAAALATIEEALERLTERSVAWRRGTLQVLAARAHGWLGDPPAAARELAETSPADRGELEPEERVPLMALAGQHEAALAENPDGPCHQLWSDLLSGAEAPDWSCLDVLEPYRAARLVFDSELVAPGCAPASWRRRAAAVLREVGADGPAERLIVDDEGPWQALEAYFSATGSAPERLTALLEALSPEASLTWRDAEEEIELVAGAGGGSTAEVPAHGGVFRLTAPHAGGAERVALALALRDLPPPRKRQRRGRPRRHGMIGESRSLIEALSRLSKLARSELPVLIHGETGTGKELAARLVHADSPRSRGPLLPVNCAALAENLLLSELFGHVRGAFTSADRDRAGIFETARGGTVFLDEIGDLPLAAQGKLLRVLQEGEVRRVGESVARPVDVRVVAATHHDLVAQVEQGDFRQDLFYRLSVGRVTLPPLRDRGQDLRLLVEHFLAAEGDGLTPRLSSEARAMLVAHSWPGNVRELRNVLTVGVALADGGTIEPGHLDLPVPTASPRGSYHEQVEAFRRTLVREAVEAEGGNRAAAARRLGLSRQALSYLTRQLNVG